MAMVKERIAQRSEASGSARKHARSVRLPRCPRELTRRYRLCGKQGDFYDIVRAGVIGVIVRTASSSSASARRRCRQTWCTPMTMESMEKRTEQSEAVCGRVLMFYTAWRMFIFQLFFFHRNLGDARVGIELEI